LLYHNGGAGDAAAEQEGLACDVILYYFEEVFVMDDVFVVYLDAVVFHES